MKKSFDNLAKLRDYVDPNYAGRDWNLATAMVIKGDALVQVMGDWAKGEFKAANKEAGKDFLCYRFPGTDGSVIYNTDMFAMFDVSADRKAAQLALADATMSISFQSAFNVVKGSVPARMDVPDTAFDICGKKGIADVKAANADGKFVGSMAQNYAQPPAVAGAYHDVVTKFFHGEIKTSDAAVAELDQGDQRREVTSTTLPRSRGGGPLRPSSLASESLRGRAMTTTVAPIAVSTATAARSAARTLAELAAQIGAGAVVPAGAGIRLRLQSLDVLPVVHQLQGAFVDTNSSASPTTRSSGPGPSRPTRRRAGTRRSSTWRCSAGSMSSFACSSA